MSRVTALAVVVVVAATPAHADETLAPEAAACGDVLRGARTRLARTVRWFADGDVDVRRARHAWSAHFQLQRPSTPAYFYVDVVDVRDDRGHWASIAGRRTWACREQVSGSQRNAECAMRHGDRIAVVRAISWRRASSVDAYVGAFRTATQACLVAGPASR